MERNRTGMPRASLPRDARQAEAVVWGIAFALATVFAIGQILTVLAVAPAAIAFHETNGGAPALVSLAEQAGPLVIGLVLGIVDLLIFALFVWLARVYWIGFVYLPPLLYLGLGSAVIWMLVSGVVASFASGA